MRKNLVDESPRSASGTKKTMFNPNNLQYGMGNILKNWH